MSLHSQIVGEESIRQLAIFKDESAVAQECNDIIFLSTTEQVSKYIDENFDTILFDCDGVLYRGSILIPDATAAIMSLLRRKKQILFITNNAGFNRRQLRDKLAALLQVETLTEEQMVTSSYSAARYLLHLSSAPSRIRPIQRVHVIGSEGLRDELRKAGFHVVGNTVMVEDASSMSREELVSYSFLHEEGAERAIIDAVVVGLDTSFNYRKLCIATVLFQRHPEALFIATNEDAYDTVGLDSRHLPGNGALVRAIEYSSQRKAVNVGKPSKILADIVREEHNLDPNRSLMIGDRLDTDVRFGKEGGMKSALVFTGCTDAKTLREVVQQSSDKIPCMPDIVFPHIGMMQ